MTNQTNDDAAGCGQILDGKATALAVREQVAARVAVLMEEGVQPGLAVVLVGEDPASQVYVRNKDKAASAAGMSYKTAWDAVDAMNKASGSPLVERSVGGRGGGGTRLTGAGEQLVAAFRRYQQEHAAFLQRLSEDDSLDPYLQVMNRLRLRTSARNQLFARVAALRPDGLNTRVELTLDGGHALTAVITRNSGERLGLCEGAEVFALIKAPWVKLAGDVMSGNRLTATVVGREQVGDQLALEAELGLGKQ